MAVFKADDEFGQERDWYILRDGGVALYWRAEILADDLSWFESKGYRIVSFETGDWHSEKEMHDALKVKLSFPDYYGRNLDALNDCMSDLELPDTGGLVLVLNRYDRFAKTVPIKCADEGNGAKVVLDILAGAVRYHMLFGKRLLILVQSEDPRIRFDNLGGISAHWNRREWLNRNRGL